MFFRCITADMAAILKNPFLRELPPQTYLAGGTAVALHLGHRLSIDLDFFTPHDLDSLQWFKGLQTAFSGDFTLSAVKIEKNTGLTFEVLLQDLSRKYTVGEEIFFQLKKSLIYFDDAERDLNVNMYATDSGRFERLADDTWRATKRYFKDMVMTGSARGASIFPS